MTGQDQRLTLKHRAASLLLAGACLLAAAPAAVSQQAKPQPASLEGSWSGGGTVVFPSGSREKAHGSEVVGGAPKMHCRKAGGGGS